MTETKYTPSPWELKVTDSTHVVDCEGEMIAHTGWHGSTITNVANAMRIRNAVNFVEGFDTKNLRPTHKHMNLKDSLSALANRVGAVEDDNPLITIENIWSVVKDWPELIAAANDDDLDTQVETSALDDIFLEFQSQFSDEDEDYLDYISDQLDTVDEDTITEAWQMWFKMTESAEDRGIMLPAVMDRLGIKTIEDWEDEDEE